MHTTTINIPMRNWRKRDLTPLLNCLLTWVSIKVPSTYEISSNEELHCQNVLGAFITIPITLTHSPVLAHSLLFQFGHCFLLNSFFFMEKSKTFALVAYFITHIAQKNKMGMRNGPTNDNLKTKHIYSISLPLSRTHTHSSQKAHHSVFAISL